MFSLAFLSHIPYLYAKFFHYIFCILFLAIKMQTYVNVYSLLLCGSYRIGFMPDVPVYNKNKTKKIQMPFIRVVTVYSIVIPLKPYLRHGRKNMIENAIVPSLRYLKCLHKSDDAGNINTIKMAGKALIDIL